MSIPNDGKGLSGWLAAMERRVDVVAADGHQRFFIPCGDLRALLAVVRAADDWKTTRDAKIIADGVDFVMANERPSDARLQAHGEHMEASNRLEDALAALPTDASGSGGAAGEG